MISEFQQEQAALYALELLDADEATAFERNIDADAALRELVRELRETAALLALAGETSVHAAPPALREPILANRWSSEQSPAAIASAGQKPLNEGRKIVASGISWLPWTLAALFMGCSGILWLHSQVEADKLNFLAAELNKNEHFASAGATATPTPIRADALDQVSFCALDPTPDFQTAQPRAAVLWDAAHRQGKLRVNRLAAVTEGKDYQLWVVESGRKDTVSAGVVHVDADGKADLPFQPVEADGKPVVAVAISLERAGGSPTNEGPILLLGKF